MGFGVRTAKLLPAPGCWRALRTWRRRLGAQGPHGQPVSLHRPPNFPEPQFPHLLNGTVTFAQLAWGRREGSPHQK